LPGGSEENCAWTGGGPRLAVDGDEAEVSKGFWTALQNAGTHRRPSIDEEKSAGFTTELCCRCEPSAVACDGSQQDGLRTPLDRFSDLFGARV